MGKSAAAVKPRSDQRSDRRALAQELLKLRRKYAVAFAQIEDLKSSLIALATAGEGSFRETFAEQGVVTVSGAKPKAFAGHFAEVQPKVWNALSDTKRRKIIEAGIIAEVPHWSREYHGSCKVKVF